MTEGTRKQSAESLDVYIPMDRRQALARGAALPDRVQGAALFADVSGFTPLTEALVRQLGSQRGAEELTRHLNMVYDAIIAELHRYGGSVIGFSGDAITCWFDGDTGLKATACALAMQETMERFAAVTIPSGTTVSLAMKTAVATGAARRFVIGDPDVQIIDVLAGATLDRLADAEHQARRGEVVLDPAALARLGDQVQIIAWRDDAETGERYGVVGGLISPVAALPWPSLPPDVLGMEQVRPWLLPEVYKRLQAGQGEFLTEFRPTVAIFLRFGGIDYDADKDAGDKLDAYLRWVQSVLVRYEGYPLQLTMGDKGSYLCAALGAPVAHEDDAARAVSAALELREPPPELDFIDNVQIGICQGLTLSGAYGGTMRRIYGVLGDDVNLAARLMQAAAPGQILVSQPVRQAAEQDFVWQSLPSIRVKGKTEPVTVFSVQKRRARAARLQGPDYALPMVGREAELALIESKLNLALDGKGQLIGVTGEAGIGKTRLVAEGIRLARDREVVVYDGECESYGTHSSYLVWRSIWRAFFGVDASWDLADQMRLLRTGLERVDSTLVPRLPLLGAALNLSIPDNDLTRSFDAKLRRSSLEALLVDCLRARVKETPLLLVLEDCHWLDPLSHDLLEVIGRALADLPVLVMLAYRPAKVERLQAPRISRLPHFTEICLTDFELQEVERLITLKLEQLLGAEAQVSPDLVERITARAEGNPFYIEELLNYLHNRGIDPRDSEALRQLDLPTSLHSLILSRLDQLSESQKTTLKVASIIGRLFRAALLWGMYPELGEPARIKADLEALRRLELTTLDTPEPELTYLFKHIITQEVAYESLPYATRAMLHEQLAWHIERVYTAQPDQYVDLLAYHFERSQNEAKKREYLRKAGEAAQASYANKAAIDYYRRAFPLLSPEEQMAVLPKLGEVLTLVGQYDEALVHFASARTLVKAEISLPDRARHLADLCRQTAVVHERRSEYDLAVEWLEKGLGYLDGEPTIEAVRLYILQAGIYYRQGKFKEAIEWCEKSLALASQIKTREGQQALGRTYHLLGGIYIRHGDLERAVHFSRKGVEVYEGIDDLAGQSKAYNSLGNAYTTLGDWDQASDAFQKTLALSRKLGDVLERGFVTNNLGNIFLYRGEWSEAAALFGESNTIWKQVGAALPEAVTLSNLGQVYIYQENWPDARVCLDRSRTIFDEIGSEGYLPELERRWGEFFLKTGELDQALAHARRSMDLALAQADRLEEGMSSRVVGEIHLARDELEAARTALCQSLEILSELNSEYEAAKTIVSLARLALKAGSTGEQAPLTQAIQTFERLGAQADLAAALAVRQ